MIRKGVCLKGEVDAGLAALRLEHRAAEDVPCVLEAAGVCYLRNANESSELRARHAHGEFICTTIWREIVQ